MNYFSSSALLAMVSNRIWVYFDGLSGALVTDGQNPNQLGVSGGRVGFGGSDWGC